MAVRNVEHAHNKTMCIAGMCGRSCCHRHVCCHREWIQFSDEIKCQTALLVPRKLLLFWIVLGITLYPLWFGHDSFLHVQLIFFLLLRLPNQMDGLTTNERIYCLRLIYCALFRIVKHSRFHGSENFPQFRCKLQL